MPIQFAKSAPIIPGQVILKFSELLSFTHLDVLDGLPGVQGVEASEVGRLLDDVLVPVQRTRDSVGPTRAVTRDIASGETHVTRAHVMRVGDAEVVVKPGTRGYLRDAEDGN